ncbi:hypothetical protein TEA_020973 [Camellia sinensis var. sinensis]|uniref:Exocyst complex component Sec8 n=1 Tax=Camellia sinensis var. sinensis TaxID=542762 RepID=A0A4S4ECM7_CAMSN|nr:hypothetical protein TEA_020973 [Camellia sinensis var. sinensis]
MAGLVTSPMVYLHIFLLTFILAAVASARLEPGQLSRKALLEQEADRVTKLPGQPPPQILLALPAHNALVALAYHYQATHPKSCKREDIAIVNVKSQMCGNGGRGGLDSSSINERDDEVPTTTVIAFSMNNSIPLSRRTRSMKGDNQFGSYGVGDGSYRTSSVDGGSSFDGHDEDGAMEIHDEAALDGHTAPIRVNGGDKDVKIVSRQISTWLSDSTPDEFVEAMRKSDAPLHVKYLQTMVECLCMLGKVSAAGVIICQRLRPTIHDIITGKIKGYAEHFSCSRAGIGQAAQTITTGLHYLKGHLESYQLPKQKRQNGISLAGTLLAVSPVSPVMAPMGTAQAAAKELLNSILDAVVRIFENHVIVGELLESKSSQQSDMNTPKSMAEINWNPDSDASHDTGGYSIGFSLTVLQDNVRRKQYNCNIVSILGRLLEGGVSICSVVSTSVLVI